MIVEGDDQVRPAQPAPCHRLFLDPDGRTIVAVVQHGVWQGWHRIEVDEGADRVVVTAYVGTLNAIADRQARGENLLFVLKGVLRPVRIPLSEPLGGRLLQDGAKAGG